MNITQDSMHLSNQQQIDNLQAQMTGDIIHDAEIQDKIRELTPSYSHIDEVNESCNLDDEECLSCGA